MGSLNLKAHRKREQAKCVKIYILLSSYTVFCLSHSFSFTFIFSFCFVFHIFFFFLSSFLKGEWNGLMMATNRAPVPVPVYHQLLFIIHMVLRPNETHHQTQTHTMHTEKYSNTIHRQSIPLYFVVEAVCVCVCEHCIFIIYIHSCGKYVCVCVCAVHFVQDEIIRFTN